MVFAEGLVPVVAVAVIILRLQDPVTGCSANATPFYSLRRLGEDSCLMSLRRCTAKVLVLPSDLI